MSALISSLFRTHQWLSTVFRTKAQSPPGSVPTSTLFVSAGISQCLPPCHLCLSHTHHFFNSSDSPASFTPQGLCTYFSHFLAFLPVHSQAPPFLAAFCPLFQVLAKLRSLQQGRPLTLYTSSCQIFLCAKGQISNIFALAGQKVSAPAQLGHGSVKAA